MVYGSGCVVTGGGGDENTSQGLLVFYYYYTEFSTSSLISKLVTVMLGISIIHKEEPS